MKKHNGATTGFTEGSIAMDILLKYHIWGTFNKKSVVGKSILRLAQEAFKETELSKEEQKQGGR